MQNITWKTIRNLEQKGTFLRNFYGVYLVKRPRKLGQKQGGNIMDRDWLMKKLGKAQEEIYKKQSIMISMENLVKTEEEEPEDMRIRIHLENKKVMKFRLIVCPEINEPNGTGYEDKPCWPLHVINMECDFYDFYRVIKRIFMANQEFFVWDGTTDILTKSLSDD